MKRTYPRTPSEVVERRLGMADAPPKKAAASDTMSQMATLGQVDTTPEQRFWARRYIWLAPGSEGVECDLMDKLNLGGLRAHEADLELIRQERLREAGEPG